MGKMSIDDKKIIECRDCAYCYMQSLLAEAYCDYKHTYTDDYNTCDDAIEKSNTLWSARYE